MDNVKFYNWNKIFDKAGKKLLENLKKGAQIGVLGTALTAGTMFGVGCSQPTGGNTKDDGANILTGSQPYDRTIGNGNYVLHNFIGDNFSTGNDAMGITNAYLNAGKNYIFNSINQLNTSLEGRAAAKNYLSNYTTLNKIVNDNANSYSNPGRAIDSIVSNITSASQDVLTNIVLNLNTGEYNAFEYVYHILVNEAYIECLGFYRDGSTFMDDYKAEKASIIEFAVNNELFANFDLEQEFGDNNFINITNIMDQLLDTAVNNINNRQGLDFQPNDIRQVINLNLAASSINGMHERVKASVDHTAASCARYTTEISAIQQAIKEANSWDYEQSQAAGGMTY